MPVQTTYATEHNEAYQGQVADLQLLNTVTGLNASLATIHYGAGVFTDATHVDGIKLGASGADAATFKGVVMRELNRAYADNDTFGVPDGREGTIVTHGVVWVKALEAVAKDDKVYVRVGATGKGDFAKSAGTGATESIEIPGAKWVSAASANGLAKISLGLGG